MGRPKADLCSYSPWGCIPIPPPVPPNPLWLPVIPWAGVQTWSDLAMWQLIQPLTGAKVSLFTNFYQPESQSALANFTAPTAGGLLPIQLPTPTRLPVDNCGRARWQFPNIVFTATGPGLPEMIWGYYVYCRDPWTGQAGLLWAQRLINAWGFVSAGQQLSIPLSTSFAQC